jgi:hypothetical protein
MDLSLAMVQARAYGCCAYCPMPVSYASSLNNIDPPCPHATIYLRSPRMACVPVLLEGWFRRVSAGCPGVGMILAGT